MKQLIKQILKNTSLYDPLRNWDVKRRGAREIAEWERNGKPVPTPHIVKQRTLRTHAAKYGLRILVETGTCYGDMVEAMKDVFSRIYSIELSRELYEKAKARFRRARHIELIHGDSGSEMKNIMGKIDGPTLFWLDGHYSGGPTAKGEKDTPIFEELKCILGAPDRGHVIIIDDARCFGSDSAYPTMAALVSFITTRRPNVRVVVEDDSIRVTPK